MVRGSSTFYHGVIAEMKKVTWPDRPQVRSGDDRDHHLRARCSGRSSRFSTSILQGMLIKVIPVALRGAMIAMAEHRWYAIQTTAGHENKVRSLIQRKIDADARAPEERPIRQALVPTQEVVEIKNGKKVNVERKLYPGYVLVEMVMNQETAHVINGIQGVIKFVGHDQRSRSRCGRTKSTASSASPTSAEEEEPKEEIPFLVGQAVAITEGPFTDFNGTVEEVMADKGKVRVSVSLFGRPTSVELDYLQLKAY